MFSGFLSKISIIRDIFISVTGKEEVTGWRWIQTNSDEKGDGMNVCQQVLVLLYKYKIIHFCSCQNVARWHIAENNKKNV
jgi:hypothetical protein